ncbi:low-density lipoprotein receptor-related protein 2 [Drosophila busckii]|uniref:low-density lipoprotein receptor-related protein 2 n=1 Tax=Drosophila busckii TaxID=30019 RepID=UPI001432AF73|nr:low-density lipoprotein receptor-related protein 2 [Drosophila busckii]
MKVTLLTVVTVAAVVSLATAADPECLYRKLRGLTPHWPNPADCASYYRCNSKDIMRPIKCPEGKEYNPKNGKCGTAGRGLCTLTLSAPLTDPANICANEVNGAYLAKEGSCTEFYICSNQQAYTQKCDSGSYFNGGTECVPDTDDTCWENACIGKKDGNYLTNTASCRDYITCQKEQATLESCPAGSLFDANLQMCRTDEKNEECWENYCIGQPSGEYLANKDDCGAFYICYNDSPVPSKCSPGTFFNISGPHCQPGECPSDDTTTTSTTTVPTPGECDCANGVKHGQMVPNENNCRKFFTCNNGELVSGDCYTGNYFNPKLECCDRDVDNICPESSDEDCINGEVAANVDKCNKYYECCGGSWQSKTCDSGDYFFEGQCQPDTKNECPETDDSVEDTKIEDFMECAADEPTRRTDNCFSYLACMHGRWEQLSCRAGYYYDAFRHICKLDELNVCPENQPAKERARRSAEQPPAANCTCPDDMEQGAMTVHPTDCDKYLICNNGELVEGTCGQGNIFSTCNNICVPDTEGTCWVCANRPNGYQMADPDDCTSYYICNNGLANEMSCRASERYDAGSSACVVDVTGVCLNPCSCGTGIAAHPICNKYYQCTDGTPQVVECPAGQGFDATAEACSAKVTCAANQCATAPDGQTFPVAGDDNAYYVCLDNEAGIRLCPVNSIYDDVLGICLAQPALCSCNQNLCNNANINMPYPSLDNDNTTYCLCQSDGAYLKNCPTGYSFDEEEGICTFTTPCDPRSCIDQEKYHVSADYQDQNNFCLCRAGQPVSVPCPIGYTFSIKTMMCVVIVQPDPRCCRNYCVGKPNYETFPAIDIEEGYCTCLDDVPSYHNCPADKIYYDDLGICLKPSNIECNDPICGSTVCPNGLDGEALVAPNEPSGYCYCQNMCGVYNQCPDGKLFDQIMGICLDAALDYCQCQQCSDLPNEATFPSSNADDPTSYCLCQGGTAMYKTCGSGNRLIYDVELGICVPNQAPSTVCKTGLCAKQPENTALPALNTTAGFCVCVSNVPVYEACPGGATFDDVLCICINTGLQAAIVEQYKCDVQQCKQRSHVGPFAARDDATGFCSCEMDGAATYHSCSPGHLYEASLSTCIVDACDHMECRQRKQFEAFAAKNSTKGFCACDVVPSYHHCRDGYVFDIGLAVCVPDFQLAKPMPHEIQKRSVPQEEKVRSISLFKRFLQKLT